MATTAGLLPTTNGDGIHPASDFSVTSQAQIRLVVAQYLQMNVFNVHDAIRGYVFVIDPATLQPQLPRSTIFPSIP